MRIYLPATSEDLTRLEGVPARAGHAVTPALRRALPEEDDDGLADSAMLAAADESVTLLQRTPAAAPRRIVLAVDVADAEVDVPRPLRPWRPGDDRLPSAVDVPAMVRWRDVASIHVDEAAAADDVRAAIADDDALDLAAEHELQWYDIVEREQLAAHLSDTAH